MEIKYLGILTSLDFQGNGFLAYTFKNLNDYYCIDKELVDRQSDPIDFIFKELNAISL